MTAEILAVAGAHVARDGAAALSLRSIARDLGMAPSALYRYFDGRDALLSALILGAYEALATEAERAADRAEDRRLAVTPSGSRRCPRALRVWALEHPHLWGLIFGTPVPGYEAPEDTLEPYTRLAAGARAPAGRGGGGGPTARRPARRGPCRTSWRLRWRRSPKGSFPGCRWTRWCSRSRRGPRSSAAISLEVFGHWRNTVLDPALLFEAAIRQMAESIGLE